MSLVLDNTTEKEGLLAYQALDLRFDPDCVDAGETSLLLALQGHNMQVFPFTWSSFNIPNSPAKALEDLHSVVDAIKGSRTIQPYSTQQDALLEHVLAQKGIRAVEKLEDWANRLAEDVADYSD